MYDDVLTIDVEGEQVRLTVDEPEASSVGCGRPPASVLMLAPFGMNADSLFAPAYVLARNGLRTLRLDPRNSPDGSRSAVLGFRMSRLLTDLRTVLARVQPEGLFAMSLSVPPAVRALRHAGSVRAAALVVPVVHVRSTIRAVCQEDWFDRVTWDPVTRVVHVLGHDVDLEFVEDCLRQRFETPDDVVVDLAAVRADVHLVAGTDDPWVDLAEVRQAALASGARLVQVPAAGHLLYRNPVVAMRFFERAAQHLLSTIEPSAPPVRVPPFAEVVAALESSRRSTPVPSHLPA